MQPQNTGSVLVRRRVAAVTGRRRGAPEGAGGDDQWAPVSWPQSTFYQSE